MPITRGPGVVVTPPETVPGRGSLPRLPDPGEYQITWIAPADRIGVREEILLTPPGQSFFTLKQIAGLGVADRDITASANPAGGSVIDSIRYTPRQLVIPFRIRDRDSTAFKHRWRMIGESFDLTKTRGPGTIRFDYADGTSRQIGAVYQSGWGNEPGDGAWIEDTCTVTFICPDPMWRDPQPLIYERGIETAGDYLNPYPTIGSGQVLGDTEFTNPGQDDIWPDWEIVGPFTSLVATNVTRGQTFTLTYNLGVGETITMTSQPIQVRGPIGQNLTNALGLKTNPAGKPWRLDARTTSQVTFTAAGSGPTTLVRLTLDPGYIMA